MEGNVKYTITLHQPTTYQITVPGVLNAQWADFVEGLQVSAKTVGVDQSVTVLTCTVDQAALHSLLRRLYGLGLPIVSVVCIDA
ncbi:hypothetical protein ACFLYO_10500 [Chloroflexota bacterium]